jgi:hypothetical protein
MYNVTSKGSTVLTIPNLIYKVHIKTHIKAAKPAYQYNCVWQLIYHYNWNTFSHVCCDTMYNGIHTNANNQVREINSSPNQCINHTNMTAWSVIGSNIRIMCVCVRSQ